MLKIAGAQLGELGTGNERKNHVCRKSLLEIRLDAKRVCCVDQDACMLRSDDRLNDGGNVVNVGESLDAQEDVVVRRSRCLCCFFRSSNDYERLVLVGIRCMTPGACADLVWA